ncbi:Protein of unknown function (DUF559)/Domain of unknown function (DUF4095) [Frankia torreyi]|uniref:DUF559 domain-containing protein n=1 Tax=Frankia torreyi TaxID=1856 RepID=A0A0D8BGE3_9ACTN|nr:MULTISPECIES: type IV toxin-antitoxin system AbiEi family antitoxin domain-containing protein [Frankia]KJE23140.1 Protein of unknown function (DUF559)/Domain of unknown function (DUF4095) [Frankia torreyi]KQM06663.1 Protein of unknown function (DUF559)/Domain of unknown function (DUF4095) [Frankia sp. CpI1-P]
MDLPALPLSLRRLAARQDGMLTRTQIRQAGLTRRQLDRLVRGAGCSTPFRGTVLLPGAHPLRGPVRAALVGRPEAVVCGVTAARLLGLPGLDQTGTAREPVHLLLPRSAHAAAGIDNLIRHLGALRPDERQLRRGIPVTTVERTLADLVLDSDRETAVSLLDAALHQGRVPDIGAVLRPAAGRRGVVARRHWFALADGRAESPLETRLRLLLLDAGLPPEELQWQVWDPASPTERGRPTGSTSVDPLEGTPDEPPDRVPTLGGRPVARLDLAWPSRLVAVEADGAAYHRQPRALFRDRMRQNDLLAAGWTLLRFTWADVLGGPAGVAEMVRRALALAEVTVRFRPDGRPAVRRAGRG